MNTFSSSTAMTLTLARRASGEPAQQAQARATFRALKAEQRRARTAKWHRIAKPSRHVALPASVPTTA